MLLPLLFLYDLGLSSGEPDTERCRHCIIVESTLLRYTAVIKNSA